MVKIDRIGNSVTNNSTTNNIFPLRYIGQNIFASDELYKNEQISRFVTRNNLSTLNNYAEHESILIRINPAENNSLYDIDVKVSKMTPKIKPQNFQIKIGEGKKAFGEFIHELHLNVSKIAKAMRK